MKENAWNSEVNKKSAEYVLYFCLSKVATVHLALMTAWHTHQIHDIVPWKGLNSQTA